jgi:hypothetical protein
MCFAIRAFLLLNLMLLGSWSAAQGNDPIGSRLDKAKQGYRAKIDVYRDLVNKRLDEAEGRAIKVGNKELADLIEQERVTFNRSEVVPTSINPSDLVARRDAARRLLVTAYGRAVQDYTKTNRRDLATAVESEFKTLLEHFERSAMGGVRSWDNKVVRIVNLATARALEVRPSPEPHKNELVAANVSDNSAQLWVLTKQTQSEQYQLLNRQFKNMSVNVPQGRSTPALKLIAYTNQKGAVNELWSIRPVGPAFQLLSSNGLAMAAATLQDGSAIVQVAPSGTKAELWTIQEVGEN